MYMPHAAIFAVTEAFVSTSRESIWKLSSACTHIKKAYLKALYQFRFRAVASALLPSACKHIKKAYLKAL